MKKVIQYIKKSFGTNTSKFGTRSLLLGAILLVVLVGINILATKIPYNFRYVSLRKDKFSDIGKETENVLKNVNEDIMIYLLAEENSVDELIELLIQNYVAGSERISYKIIEPSKNPSFLTNRKIENAESNSIIVESDKRFKYIASSEIYEETIDYVTYYQTGQMNSTVEFDGEGEITAAIDFVTISDLPQIYVVEGHKERAIDDYFKSSLDQNNFETTSINLLTTKIPEECDILYINCPSVDYSKDEADAVIEYLKAGGDAVIALGAIAVDFTNFYSILSYYGVDVVEGLVLEQNANYYYQTPTNLFLPIVEGHESLENIPKNSFAMVRYAVGLAYQDNSRTTITHTPLMQTSASAFCRPYELMEDSTVEKQEGDIEGTYDMAVAIEEEVGQNNVTKLTLYASPDFLSGEITANFPSLVNTKMAVENMGNMCNLEATVSIAKKNYSLEPIIFSENAFKFNMILLVFVIPLGTIVGGLIIWVKRRYK